MADHQDLINELNQKLESLLNKQESFAKELMALHKEIDAVKKLGPDTVSEEKIDTPLPIETDTKTVAQSITATKAEEVKKEIAPEPKVVPQKPRATTTPQFRKPKGKSNWEKFIGENLINKIGIAITVIGVAIGAKYSIENDLISPLTRIILGYLAGLALLGFAIKLKAKYENYSAVLVSGALAILYFITFAAYSFYGLFPQLMAFILMLVFTVFGVVAALHYNKQVIAHIGLVGAYAVPFLLSNNSGSAAMLFGYMAIINIGILSIAIKKYWKPLYYSSFVFTWLIYSSWRIFSYRTDEHFQLAFIVLSIFFLVFYATFLVYKLRTSEKFKISDVILILLNSFIFYGYGYGLLSGHETGQQLLGVFTLCNAIIHFTVSVVLYKKKLADRNLFYLIAGLVLVFITIAIPVQLDGNWVTLLWVTEAALLFWIGRTKNVAVYEYLSYPLMGLAFLSLVQDWALGYNSVYGEENNTLTPILNIHFLTSTLFLIAFAFINWINGKKEYLTENIKSNPFSKLMGFGIPAILIFVLYCAFYLEVDHYWEQLFKSSKIEITEGNAYTYDRYDYNIRDYGNIWLFNYTLLFMAGLIFGNIKKLQNRVFGIITLVISMLVIFLFLTGGLYILSELRESFVNYDDASNYERIGAFGFSVRYVAFAFFALLLYAIYKLTRQSFMHVNFKVPFETLLHISILWILSSELLNWMDILGSDQSYKLGLSILWGIYALTLIVLGIWKNKKYLRIGAIALFAITLIKLFFYDIASLNTISKTIVFVSLGVLLLIISFLYNKYKHLITDDENEK